MNLIRQTDEPAPIAPARDHAQDGYPLADLENLIRDCAGQPEWRDRADRAHSYYDFKQLSAEKRRKIAVEMGIDPVQINLIHGVINGVLGQEARARTDVRIEADDEAFADVADVLSASMKEAARESSSDMAISNAYASQVKGGIGWVEVSRASDPLDYPYRVREIHRNQIWWDWRASDIGLDTARWQVRKRWEDLDEACALMPRFAKIMQNAINGWDVMDVGGPDWGPMMESAYNAERMFRVSRDQWCDTARRRLLFHEVWYRVPAAVAVIKVSPTKRLIYDPNNRLHVEAVARGRVEITRAITRQIRMALFAGPHRLVDVGTRRRRFPYIPFFAFRDDEDGTPYGLIEGMIDPQNEYNERRQMVNWMLKARQIQVDDDALNPDYNTIEDIERAAGRPDMVAVLNSKRRNANGLRIGNDLSLQREQIEVMQDSKQLIQDVPRVYSTQLGNAPAGVTSGIAINSLTEQGTVAMGELNDNYRFARKLVHDSLLDLIIEDHLAEDLSVAIGSGQTRRVVVLNSWDPNTGAPVNRVKDAPIKTATAETPSTPAFRMQEQQNLATIIQALGGNPQALALLAPSFIESTSLPGRQQLADDLRRLSGLPVAGDREAQKQMAEQQQQAQQAAQQQAQQDAAARAANDEADAELNRSTARLNNARASQIESDMQARTQQASRDQLIQGALQEASGFNQEPAGSF